MDGGVFSLACIWGQNLFAIFIFRKAAPFQDFKRNVTSCGFVVNPLGGLTVS